MQVQVLRSPAPVADRPLRREERSELHAGNGELVVAVSACAVCRTDLRITTGDLSARRLPIVPGHQVVGSVVEVGGGVGGLVRG